MNFYRRILRLQIAFALKNLKIFAPKKREISTPPEWIEVNHWEEWCKSEVDPEIISLNVESLCGEEVYDKLLISPKIQRRNDGRVSDKYLTRYRPLEDGGFWVSGIDVLNWENSGWGQFKGDNPRVDFENPEKKIKYDAPCEMPTEVFALKVPHHIWVKVARNFNVELPENYKELGYGQFWVWVWNNPSIPIVITEGAKKAGALLSRGIVALALPGVNSGYRQLRDEEGYPIGKPRLIPQIEKFAQNGREFILAFDQDSKVSTIRSVNNAQKKTANLLKLFGCQVSFLKWNGDRGKGIDDYCHNCVELDDIDECFWELYRDRLSLECWEMLQMVRLTYKANKTVNRKYLLDRNNPTELIPPDSAQLIGLKAPKGSGKTEFIKEYVRPYQLTGEMRVLLISHRVQLSLQTAERIYIPYITELKDYELGDREGMALCVDSLHEESQAHFKWEHWGRAVIIFDEIQQLLWHLLSSQTCEKERVKIIKTLQNLLRHVIKSGGKIIVADADLNDIAIDFILGLIGFDVEKYIIVNDYKFINPWNVYSFQDKNPKRLFAKAVELIKEGKKIFFCLSAQKYKSKYSSKNLEKLIKKFEKGINKELPEIRILRIDSEAVQNPEHPAYQCTSNLNEVLKDYDIVLSTPTLETGVSIDIKHFDAVFGIFSGVSTADSVRQFLSRYREPVPRYIWVRARGLGFVGNKCTDYRGLIASSKQLDKSNRNKLIDAALEETVNGNFEPICLTTWAKLGAVINLGKWHYRDEVEKGLAAEGHNIIPESEWDIKLPDTSEVDKVDEAVKDNKNENYEQYNNDVSDAYSPDNNELETLSKKQAKTEKELLSLRKGNLERKYKVEVTPQLVEKDDNGWFSQLMLHFYFDKGRQFLQERDLRILETAIKHGDGNYFLPDFNKKAIISMIVALDALGIKKLWEPGQQEAEEQGAGSRGEDPIYECRDLERDEEKRRASTNEFGDLRPCSTTFDCRGRSGIFPLLPAPFPPASSGQIFHENHPTILEIFNFAKQNQWTLATIGLDFKRCEAPIQLVQGILQRLGLKMPRLKRKGDGRKNKRVYIYGAPVADCVKIDGKPVMDRNGFAIPLDDGREEIFKQWEIRDLELRNKKLSEEMEAAKALEEQKLVQEQSAKNIPQSVLNSKLTPWMETITEYWTDPETVGIAARDLDLTDRVLFDYMVGQLTCEQTNYIYECMAVAA